MDLSTAAMRMVADLKKRLNEAENRASIAEAKLSSMQGIDAVLDAIGKIETPHAQVDLSSIVAAIQSHTQQVLAAIAAMPTASAKGPSKIEFDLHRDGADVVRRITANIH